jgi:L-alanine-DL-glutamate epimerase-like enolase superfamily enzyme
VPWRNALAKHSIVIKDGFFQLPTRPGLGVEIDWEIAAAHPGVTKDLPRLYREDGAVTDW